MSLRLNSSGGGYVEQDAPNIAGNYTLTLPTSAGSAGQYLRNSGAAGTLEFGAPPSFVSYAIIGDQKAQGTNGGTFTSGAWRTRELNTEFADPDGIVSIASNQFTLQAGTYKIDWRAPAFGCDANSTALYNVTDASTDGDGSTGYSYGSSGTNYCQHFSMGSVRLTLSASKTFEIQHRCGYSSGTAFGFGYAANFGNEIYTVVNIYKEA